MFTRSLLFTVYPQNCTVCNVTALGRQPSPSVSVIAWMSQCVSTIEVLNIHYINI